MWIKKHNLLSNVYIWLFGRTLETYFNFKLLLILIRPPIVSQNLKEKRKWFFDQSGTLRSIQLNRTSLK